MEKLIRDLKYAGRSLMRSRGFAAAVMVTLSACVAVNVAILAIVNSVLLRQHRSPASHPIHVAIDGPRPRLLSGVPLRRTRVLAPTGRPLATSVEGKHR